MIEEKRREREKQRRAETREGRESRDGKDKTKSGRPSRRIDIIDQLDATSIYGTGCMFHLPLNGCLITNTS